MVTQAPLSPPRPEPVERAFAVAERHLKEKRPEAAEEIYETLRHRVPQHVRLWNGLGLVAHMKGRSAEARRHLEHAVALNPNEAASYNHLAVVCRAMGDTEAAVQHYRAALKLKPDEPIFLGNLGHALRSLKRYGEAVDCYRRAIAAGAATDGLKISLASALGQAKRYEEALSLLREMVETSPETPGVHLEMGNALAGLERHEEAIATYQRAAELDPANPGPHHNIGTSLQNLGRMEEAAEAYRRALALKGDFAASMRQLASIKTHVPDERETAEIERRLREENLPEEARAEFYLALASAYDSRGDYDRAWDRLQASNQIVHRKLAYDPDRNTRFVDAIINTFDKGFFAERDGWGNPSEVPVFIIGMPRSGTTLVEQILCSHPEVFGAGELMKMHELASALPARLQRRGLYPMIARHLDNATVAAVAQDYHDYLRAFSPTALRITDKMPFNYRLVGMIALCFPNARVIHCRRDPLDTCLSCYFAKFKEALDFSYNLVDLGRYYRDYERMMVHWRDTVRLRWLDMPYDELVAHQEEKSRELVAFCGLDWDPRCLNFHETDRAVLTASNWQVRQPIYRSSVARWRHYEKYLGPLIKALDEERPDAADNAAGMGSVAATGEQREAAG